MNWDAIIIGAGPAGLTAAGQAVRAGNRVLVLDKAARPGTKLLLAGGGKGNLTNTRVEHTDYIGENPAFARNVLSRLTPEALCDTLRTANIPLEERGHGRIFSLTSAKAVLDLLLSRLPQSHCRIAMNTQPAEITYENNQFSVRAGTGTFHAPRLILATGGPAWPQCGADDSGLRLARSLGHRIVPPRPVLVPFIMPSDWSLAGLAGLSLPVSIHAGPPEAPVFTDDLLFTHKGVSGPAALRASCFWRKGSAVTIDFLPAQNLEQLLDTAPGKATPHSVLARLLPERLAAALLDPLLAKRRAAELSRAQRAALAQAVHRHTTIPVRTEGLVKAEASAGGVDTAQVNPATLESRIVPNLFLCGEILDLTGNLGGYNLHWAWSSGMVAGGMKTGGGRKLF